MKDPNIVEVTYHEHFSASSGSSSGHHSTSLGKTTKAHIANDFIKKGAWYVVTLIPNGFKVRIPTMSDKRIVKAHHWGISVTGAEQGTYEIVEQTEDFITVKLKK